LADRAGLVNDDDLGKADGLSRAMALAAIVQDEGPDLILLGKNGVGTDEAQTGPMLAEVLGLPHAGSVNKLELSGDGFTAERDIEGAVEVQQGSLPAVITCEKGLNEPRYPSLKGIMQAKKKTIDFKEPGDAAAGAGMLVWESMKLPPQRSAGRIIEGEPQEAAAELVRLLNEEKKVI